MIIQCEQCHTKFRLDDSKVTDKGVKVRCAKCKYVFVVKKEQPEPQEPQQDFGAMLGASLSSEDTAEAAAQPPQADSAAGSDLETAADDAGFAPDDFAAKPESSDPFSFDLPDLDNQQQPYHLEQGEPDESGWKISAAGAEDFTPPSLEGDQGFALDRDETPQQSGEIDFGSFDFGDVSEDSGDGEAEAPGASAMAMMPPQDQKPAAADVDDSGFDFGDNALFGDAVATPAVEEPTEPITFDFHMDEFADSMGVDATAKDAKKTDSGEARGDEPFSLGEIDFGDELTSVAVQQVHPDELQPSQELLFAPLAEAQPQQKPGEEEPKTVVEAGIPQKIDEDLPPLSIGSRRKQSSIFSGLIIVVSLVVAAVLGFFGYSMFTEDKGKVVAESGRIAVRSVAASYVKNPLIGDLLVITGEAVNEYTKPRASIQIKGMVYNASGQVLATKNAYCGNPLTKEQLATLPADKIEAAMANQFGDSLANMEVAVGKAIPFVIVIAKPPAEASDYGVEPAGSTVATGK